MSQPLFPLGQILLTPGTQELLAEMPETKRAPLTRHVTGDWSEMSEGDQEENRFSVDKPLRIFSSYKLADDTKIWIITEADRSATTLLLPEEY